MSIGKAHSKALTYFAAVAIILLGIAGTMGSARALPSFARQTGYECAVCHVAFPELTPMGRLFKLRGYTTKGGDSSLPPLAATLQPAFTHTQRGQPGGAAPHFGPNDNFAIQAASVFYGGAIYSPIGLGAFAQVSYDASVNRIGWDNTDIRLAHTSDIADTNVIYGLTLNNNPTVQDVWNTIPAWRFPFTTSNLAPFPGAATLIEGGFAQQVVGLGAYGFFDNLVYAEGSLYRTLSTRTLTTLGTDSGNVADIDGAAPYWRVAVQPVWGPNSLEVGTFGLSAATFPQRIRDFGTDRRTDIGFDTQYQFIGERDDISLQASWIYEDQRWTASQALGMTSNPHDWLQSFNAKISYFYDHTYGINLARFDIIGSTDAALNAGSANGSPNSGGWVIEADYVPFMHGGPSFWPWFNVRFQLQYTIFDKFNGGRSNFDGAGRNASDNNTLFLLAWIAF